VTYRHFFRYREHPLSKLVMEIAQRKFICKPKKSPNLKTKVDAPQSTGPRRQNKKKSGNFAALSLPKEQIAFAIDVAVATLDKAYEKEIFEAALG
jgi:hypothetical protein